MYTRSQKWTVNCFHVTVSSCVTYQDTQEETKTAGGWTGGMQPDRVHLPGLDLRAQVPGNDPRTAAIELFLPDIQTHAGKSRLQEGRLDTRKLHGARLGTRRMLKCQTGYKGNT